MSRRIRVQAQRPSVRPGDRIATVAYYGPDDEVATKVAVGIVEGDDVLALERWFAESGDVRHEPGHKAKILEVVGRYGARHIVYSDGIIGCPHEEGIDYPEGQSCPQCQFWADATPAH